ncbi:MAG: ATP-dependent protease [Sphingobium sp.]|nr:ATP-dependent protease [Sphingobium sp.]
MSKQRISIFPLAGALLFPGAHLPLHIFEPRYRALMRDALARDRLIGMIQPRNDKVRPDLYSVGCLGRIVECEALDDGRFDIVLLGVSRFHLLRELDVTTAFRQVEGDVEPEVQDEAPVLPLGQRAAIEMEARQLADHLGYVIDWSAVSQLDDRALLHGIAQIAPFDVAAKQALLEAGSFEELAERTIQLLQFARCAGDDGAATLQ